MDRKGYVDNNGNPVLSASNVRAYNVTGNQLSWLDTGVSYMSGIAIETGRFLYTPDFQSWFGGKFRFGMYGMNFYGNQNTWKQKSVVKTGKSLTRFGNTVSLIGIYHSFYRLINSDEIEESADATLDLLMGAVGYTPYVGPWLSIYWSVGGKQLHYRSLYEGIMPQYEMGILGYPSTMPFK